MCASDYDEKLRVMRELLDSGIKHKGGLTTIKVGDVEVTRAEYVQEIQGIPGTPLTINVSSQATAAISVDISLMIQQVVKQLEAKGTKPADLAKAKEQLANLEAELKRTKPRWPQVRKILKWSLGMGERIFLILVAEWLKRQTM